MNLRRGENSSLLCCMVVHVFGMFYNSELCKDHNLANTVRYDCTFLKAIFLVT